MSEPTSPTSVASVASAASTASFGSVASMQATLNAKSSIVKKFARLFNELSTYDQKAYLDLLAIYIDRTNKSVNNRFFTTRVDLLKGQANRDMCYQSIINGETTIKYSGSSCIGKIIQLIDIPVFFQGFAEFLRNFKFPDAPKGTEPALSLPMLDFVSDLTSVLTYRVATSVQNCTFKMGMVDKNSFTNIQYRENTSVDTPNTPDNAADPGRMIINPNEDRDKLIEFLVRINVLDQLLGYAKGDNPLVRFNLGIIQKPTGSDNVRPLEELDPKHVSLCFRLNLNDDSLVKILILLVIDRDALPRDALPNGSRGCKFAITEVLTGGIINKWTWSGEINDLKFFPTCQPSAATAGGRKRRRSSKTKKVRARSTHRRRNIKKLKRSVYVKARNTKRNLRRFRH